MLFQAEVSRNIAEFLLDIEALKFSPSKPFVWASGLKSPIYCDNRLSLSHPNIRSYIKESLANLASTHFSEATLIAGVATAGVPHGALLADALNLPFAYVRSKPKGHGMQNLIEGKISANDKVLVVEDLVSTGGSSLKAVEAIRHLKADVLGLASIFTYSFDKSQRAFDDANCPWYSLSDYPTALKIAIEKDFVTEAQRTMLESWYKNPEEWVSAES